MPASRTLIVFDLDGTLIDSRLDLVASTNEVLVSYGASPLPTDVVAAMVGEGAKVLVERALVAAGLDPAERDALARFRTIYDRRLLETTRPYPGIPEVVEAASRRALLAVLTNKPEAPARRVLEAFGLADHFRWVIGGDSGFVRKPDPAGLRHLMAEARSTPASTVLVGDSRIDLETARAAGVPLWLARYGFGWDQGGVTLADAAVVAWAPVDLGAAVEVFSTGRQPS